MLSVIIAGGVVLLGLAWLPSKEADERQKLECSHQKLTEETKVLKAQMKRASCHAQIKVQLEAQKAIHAKSIELANAHYQDYERYKQMIASAKKHKQKFGKRIGELKQLRDDSVGKQKAQYRQQLEQMRMFHAQATDELARLYDRKAQLLAQVQQANQITHEAKTQVAYYREALQKQKYFNSGRRMSIKTISIRSF